MSVTSWAEHATYRRTACQNQSAKGDADVETGRTFPAEVVILEFRAALQSAEFCEAVDYRRT
ncbi:MAG: hypothetical protein H7Z17_20120 [Fuerstia sp.]|nr:hypothetical protein [Fuerstiella sp.]